jgi:hypothetical protein
MYLVAALSFVLGFGMGLRFRVLALLPCSVLGSAILSVTFLILHQAADIILGVIVFLFSLQAGYVLSTLLRFVWIGDGSWPYRPPKAGGWPLWRR